MTASHHHAVTDDDPAIVVYLHDAIDTLWVLEFITDWLDQADADTHDNLNTFCGRRHTIENLEATIVRQAVNIRRALATITTEGDAID